MEWFDKFTTAVKLEICKVLFSKGADSVDLMTSVLLTARESIHSVGLCPEVTYANICNWMWLRLIILVKFPSLGCVSLHAGLWWEYFLYETNASQNYAKKSVLSPCKAHFWYMVLWNLSWSLYSHSTFSSCWVSIVICATSWSVPHMLLPCVHSRVMCRFWAPGGWLALCLGIL